MRSLLFVCAIMLGIVLYQILEIPTLGDFYVAMFCMFGLAAFSAKSKNIFVFLSGMFLGIAFIESGIALNSPLLINQVCWIYYHSIGVFISLFMIYIILIMQQKEFSNPGLVKC